MGSGGSYLFIRTSSSQKTTELYNEISELKNQNLAIEEKLIGLENEVSSHQYLLSTITDKLQRLEDDIENLKKIMASNGTIDIDDLYNMSYIMDEGFEKTSIGARPIGWSPLGSSFDTVNVQDNHSYSPTKSLKLHENGGDGNHCEITITGVNATRNLLLDMRFMISGEPGGLAVFKLRNEEGKGIVSINCRSDDRWGYFSPGGWRAIANLPTPVAGKWYRVQILADRELQKARIIVDGYDSGWLESRRSWESIKEIGFRGNDNFPADSWYDDIKIIQYQLECPP